jgi:hypothetical protein
MAVRLIAPAVLLLALAGCGGTSPVREVRVLAPAWVVGDLSAFERETGCRVDLRVYDDGEDLAAIARRRDVDVIAAPVRPGQVPDRTESFVRVTVNGGVEITVPEKLASAFKGLHRPAGRRSIAWTIRTEGENPACARRWIAYAASQ